MGSPVLLFSRGTLGCCLPFSLGLLWGGRGMEGRKAAEEQRPASALLLFRREAEGRTLGDSQLLPDPLSLRTDLVGGGMEMEEGNRILTSFWQAGVWVRG